MTEREHLVLIAPGGSFVFTYPFVRATFSEQDEEGVSESPTWQRVFFTRKWTDPDGKTFGKNKLHIKTASAFRSLIAGYRHEFELATPAQRCDAAIAVMEER